MAGKKITLLKNSKVMSCTAEDTSEVGSNSAGEHWKVKSYTAEEH